MPVMLRIDDFLYTKVEEYRSGRHTLDTFMMFMDVIPCRFLLGMIPGSMTDLRVGQSFDKIVPAIHGFTHDESRQNEFQGYGLSDIQRMIASGREIISAFCGGRIPQIYMPPHNVIDIRTVIACKSLGISAITGGPETDRAIASVIRSQGIKYVESVPPFEYGRSDELMQMGAVEHLHFRHSRGDTVVLGLHWTWETNIGLDSFRNFIGMIEEILVDFDHEVP